MATVTERADALSRSVRRPVRAAVLRGKSADALTHLDWAAAAVGRIAALAAPG